MTCHLLVAVHLLGSNVNVCTKPENPRPSRWARASTQKYQCLCTIHAGLEHHSRLTWKTYTLVYTYSMQDSGDIH